jgi:ferric-dicitrate binding protein FerR (iron transport regulator)
MNPTTEYIYSIIAKSLTEKLDDAESLELAAWKSATPGNLREYNDFVSIWKQSESMVMQSAIDRENAVKILKSQSGIFKEQKRWLTWAVQVAAVLLLSVIFSGVYSYLNRDSSVISNQIVYQEIKAAFGTQAKVELADGTTVFLNSGSKLRFPQTFDNQEQRKVVLDGEGFFTVAKNEKQPFIVEANKLDIKVLGTIFNVDAYADNELVLVTLVEGSVKLQDNSGAENKDLMELLPNQIATLSLIDNTLVKTDVIDLHKYTAWVNGRIVFFGDPIQTVVKKLEKWYNVDIVISDKRLENYRFTGTFIDESLEQILSILSRTSPMTYDILPVQKQADQSISKRIIILKSRS